MVQKYSNVNYLKNFDIINKYNLVKNTDIFKIDKICFELYLKKDTSDANFNYKLCFYLYVLFHSFSYINYKIIAGNNRNVSFSLKFEGVLTNKVKIESFLYSFLLEKKNLLTFKDVTQKILQKTSYLSLTLMFSLKDYIQLNPLKISNFSYTNLEQEIILLTFRLSKKFLTTFFSKNTLTRYTHYFSFWKLLVKHK